MKKPFSAERQAPEALPHDSVLESSLTAVASKRGAVDGRPAPPSGHFLYRYAKDSSRADVGEWGER